MYAIVNQTPPAPYEVNPSIPEPISDIVMKCLEKDPSNRFSDAAHIAARLEEFKSPSGSRPITSVDVAVPTSVQAKVDDVPSSSHISMIYAPVTAGVLAVLYGIMLLFGLPDWVFPLGIVLMLMGLPVLLLAANQDRRKAEGRDIGRPFGWLTYRLAVRGGFFSMGGLLLLTAVFMIMRQAGIGPAGSLQASGALESNAKIIVAEFENRTTEPGLSSSISELLRIALSQSGSVEVMDGADILAVLGRMNKSSDDPIDLNTAMEIAAREGAEAVLHGEISPIGAGFFLSAKLLAAHDGSELVALSQTARSENDVIDAVDELTKDLRERIGESIKSIRGNSDLDRVTTSSLDALRLYTQGVNAEERGDYQRSVDLLQQATERDPEFAMAFRKLAVVLGNAGTSYDKVVLAATKAYELRERLPERERFMTIAYYHSSVTNDRERAIGAYRSLLECDPNNTAALNNLSLHLQRSGEYEEAELMLKRALELGDRTIYYRNLFSTLTALKKFDEAEALIDQMEQVHPGQASIPSLRFNLAVFRGNLRAAKDEISAGERSTQPFWLAWDALEFRVHSEMTGKVVDSERYVEEQAAQLLAAGNRAGALSAYIESALRVHLATGSVVRAQALVEEGLSIVPMDSIPQFNRPTAALAYFRAKTGDVASAERLMNEFESLPPGVQLSDPVRILAYAEIAFQQGNSEDAISILRKGRREERCDTCFNVKEAEMLANIDSVRQAIVLYEQFQDMTWGFAIDEIGGLKAPAWLEMGELYSRNGQTEKAIDAYSNFVDMWAEADSDLQPKVRYARERIERLFGSIYTRTAVIIFHQTIPRGHPPCLCDSSNLVSNRTLLQRSNASMNTGSGLP